MEPAGIAALSDWLISPLPTTARVIADDGGKTAITRASKPLADIEALRLVECLCRLELGAAVTAVGQQAQDIARELRTKVAAHQQSRPDEGHVIQPGFDTWRLFCEVLAAAAPSSYVPVRTDTSMAPKLAKRTRSRPPKPTSNVKHRSRMRRILRQAGA